MVTASGDEQKIKALEAGADDFLTKPIDQQRAARPGRLVGADQALPGHRSRGRPTELAAWNRELEDRVQEQVDQLERMAKLRRFLSPQLAELIVDSGDESFLDSHRREIVVVFCDLRGFTPFAEASEPEEVMGVLSDYHEALGDLIFRFEGTLERFAGDGLMVFFNDPVRCEDGPLRAIRMSVAMRTRVRASPRRGAGRATTWRSASASRRATRPSARSASRAGSTTRPSAASPTSRRGCASDAEPWQILVTERVFAAAGPAVVGEDIGDARAPRLQPSGPSVRRSRASTTPRVAS